MIIVLLFLLSVLPRQFFAQKSAVENNLLTEKYLLNYFEFGLEYYSPSHWNRQIKTININGFIGKEFIKSIGLKIFAGATITHAWGNTIMVNEFLKEAEYKTSAMGVGPILLLRVEPFNITNFSFSVDGLGGIIFYNKAFPPRGDFYNFMFRLGGSITFYAGRNYSLNLGLRRMHISNGQGVGSFNPFYEGTGLSLNLNKKF